MRCIYIYIPLTQINIGSFDSLTRRVEGGVQMDAVSSRQLGRVGSRCESLARTFWLSCSMAFLPNNE